VIKVQACIRAYFRGFGDLATQSSSAGIQPFAGLYPRLADFRNCLWMSSKRLLVTELKPSPIEPSWIIEGSPDARSCVLSKSTCGSAWTMLRSCSESKLNWYYDCDETIMILEGSIVLGSEGMLPKLYSAGGVILFREGSHAKWHVVSHVKKTSSFAGTIRECWICQYELSINSNDCRAAVPIRYLFEPNPSTLRPLSSPGVRGARYPRHLLFKSSRRDLLEHTILAAISPSRSN
jgi:uncharacterized cupin superfamily protein